jgi:hypothetical protein
VIQFFPPGSEVHEVYYKALQLYTTHIIEGPLTPAERIAAHFCAMRLQRSLQHNNSMIGRQFCLCVYDGLRAAGIPEECITLNVRASKARNDDIDICVTLPTHPERVYLFYLKTSLRERWKQVDRDARYAKERWGKGATTACLIFAEHGVSNFHDDLKNPTSVTEHLNELEYWAPAVDYYLALSQVVRVNRLLQDILEDIAQC